MARKPLDPASLSKKEKGKPKAKTTAKVSSKAITVTATTTVPVPDTTIGIKHRLFAAYIQDVQERGVETIFDTTLDDDGKPLFPKYIARATARNWCLQGNWHALRHEALADLEIRTFEALKDQILKQRIKETKDLWDVREALISHLGPKRDRLGNVILYPIGSELEGLPVLNHAVKGGYTKLLEAFLKLDERISDRRNETIKHLGATIDEAKGIDPNAEVMPTNHEADTPEKDLVRRLSYTPEAMRKMAHEILRRTGIAEDEEGAGEAEESEDGEEEPIDV